MKATQNIKLTYNDSERESIYVELCRMPSGNVKAFVYGLSLKGCKVVAGHGYDKYGVALSNALNLLTGQLLCDNGGQGVDYTIDNAAKYRIKIEKSGDTKSGQLYKFINLNHKFNRTDWRIK